MLRHCDLREMKTLEMFCASQAATTICTSLEQRVKIPEAATRSATSQQNPKHGRTSISSKWNHGEENIVKFSIHEKTSSDQVIET